MSLYSDATRPAIGLQTLPAANEPWTWDNERARVETVLYESGADLTWVGPWWSRLEPLPHEYDFSSIDRYVQLAIQHNLQIAGGIYVINTTTREMPPDLNALPFDHLNVQARFFELLEELLPRFHGRLRWLSIGNEVDFYFAAHPDDVPSYARFLAAAKERIKEIQPDLPVSTCITCDWFLERTSLLPANGRADLNPLLELVDYLDLTYYPLPATGSVRTPEEMQEDLAFIHQIRDGKKLLFQELGCPSSPLTGSSPQRQAEFFEVCFNDVESHPNDFFAANFMVSCDWSEEIVERFGHYYGRPGDRTFLAFLQTLGLYDLDAKPKPAWDVFRTRARHITGR